MAQEAGDEPLADDGQVQVVVRVVEGVVVAAEQRLVGMHPAAVGRGKRLGHERGVHALLLGQFLDDHARGHDVVGHGQSIGVLEVDFVLAGRALVVGIFYGDAHFRQVEYGVPAQVGSGVAGELVVIPVGVQGFRRFGVPQVEIFQLGPHVVDVAQAGETFQVTLQDVARVSDERLAPGECGRRRRCGPQRCAGGARAAA